jgi:hypothetical protein
LYQGGRLARSKGIWFSILKIKVTVVNDDEEDDPYGLWNIDL